MVRVWHGEVASVVEWLADGWVLVEFLDGTRAKYPPDFYTTLRR